MGHYQKSLGTTSSGLQLELGNRIKRQLHVFSLQMEEVKMMKFCFDLYYTAHNGNIWDVGTYFDKN